MLLLFCSKWKYQTLGVSVLKPYPKQLVFWAVMKNFLNVKFWFATGLKPDSFCQPAFYLTLINHVTKTFLKESSFSATYHYPFHIIQDWVSLNVMRCAIWYHLCNSKNVKNTHGEVLLLEKLQAKSLNFTKSSTTLWVFFTFLKLYKWYQIAQNITYMTFWLFLSV